MASRRREMVTPSNIPPCGGVNGLAGLGEARYRKQDTGRFKDVSGGDGNVLVLGRVDVQFPAVLDGSERGVVVLLGEELGEALVVSHQRLVVGVAVWFVGVHSRVWFGW